jgi:hypothetical protein
VSVQLVPQAIAIMILIGERQIGAVIEIHPVREEEVVVSSVELPALPAPAS